MTLKNIQDKLSAQGLKVRQEQLTMIETVADALKKSAILCIEAPTGTGKTLAYCLGALQNKKDLKDKKEKQPLIISTATTALQEQFFQKDLPLLEKIIGQSLSVLLAKGRRRYVCHARIFKPETFMEVGEHVVQLSHLRDLLQNKKWDGELDKLPGKVDQQFWQQVSTDANGCLSSRCEYFEECVFFKNRRKMHQADIVVINHSLLLSDLELGGGVILPAMKESTYIIDECHHLPEKALSHFAKQAALIRSLEWLNGISKNINKISTHVEVKAAHVETLNNHVKHLVEALWQAKQYFDERAAFFNEQQLRITQLDVALTHSAQQIILHAGKIAMIIQALLRQLEITYETYLISDKDKSQVIAHLQGSIQFIVERAENLQATWQDLLLLGDTTKKVPMACWVEKLIPKHHQDEKDYTLHTSPINVSQAMRDLFWNKVEHGVVLCSATIRALGEFTDFLRKMGLKDLPQLITKALNSPFEYERSILFVPSMQHEPSVNLQDAHLQEMAQLLPKLILPKSGTLVLFTSRRALEWVYQHMDAELKNDVLLQENYGKMELINLHKAEVDAGRRSIIFGLASFAEGIDLPGKYCQHVIIQKIPFTVPTDPISQTRSDWIKQHRGDPFKMVTLPETSIKLAQYLGRLLRHEDDRGIVTILDKRLYTKGYGKALLESLPAFTRLVDEPVATLYLQTGVAELFN